MNGEISRLVHDFVIPGVGGIRRILGRSLFKGGYSYWPILVQHRELLASFHTLQKGLRLTERTSRGYLDHLGELPQAHNHQSTGIGCSGVRTKMSTVDSCTS